MRGPHDDEILAQQSTGRVEGAPQRISGRQTARRLLHLLEARGYESTAAAIGRDNVEGAAGDIEESIAQEYLAVRPRPPGPDPNGDRSGQRQSPTAKPTAPCG